MRDQDRPRSVCSRYKGDVQGAVRAQRRRLHPHPRTPEASLWACLPCGWVSEAGSARRQWDPGPSLQQSLKRRHMESLWLELPSQGPSTPGFLPSRQPPCPRHRLPHSGCLHWALWPAGHLGIRDFGQIQGVLKLWGLEEWGWDRKGREGSFPRPLPSGVSQPTQAPWLISRTNQAGQGHVACGERPIAGGM